MISYNALKARFIPDVIQSYAERDTMLYALGLGLGLDPVDPNQLDYVYESGLKALPTMAAVLAHARDWVKEKDTGFDYLTSVHGEHYLTMHRPMPTAGLLRGKTRVSEVVDKGSGRGAIVDVETCIFLEETGTHIATSLQSIFFRGAGGFGGPVTANKPVHLVPERPADKIVEHRTSPQGALIYRLSGDDTPFHADPDVARSSGFARPILHGLASFGIAGHAIVSACCGGDPARLILIGCRFTDIVFPGETLLIEIWHERDIVSFRGSVVERGAVVMNHGRAVVATGHQQGIL